MNESTARPSARAAAPAIASEVHSNLASVAMSRVYFGHQSVGANILDGLRELSSATLSAALKIVGTRDVDSVAYPAVIEFPIGENGDPASKASDFASALDKSSQRSPAIALFKYCYLDVTPSTDVTALFTAHRAGVRALQARHPNIIFVHVTAPLTTVEPAPKVFLKRLLGKRTARDANQKRNEFNDRLRREFEGEPIFDLARVESTRPDGTRAFFVSGGNPIYILAEELTDDGGHLNAMGRRAAAMELVAVLAELGAARARAAPVRRS